MRPSHVGSLSKGSTSRKTKVPQYAEINLEWLPFPEPT